jgi:AAA ATPase domain
VKISVKNLGALKQAEFTLGNMTIICGGNNTGKTYAAYALFGFLFTWRRMLPIEIGDDKIAALLSDGVIRLEIQEYVSQAEEILAKGCQIYTRQLSSFFATQAERFKEAKFHVSLDAEKIHLTGDFNHEIGSGTVSLFSITKDAGSTELVVTLLVEKEKVKIPNEILKRIIADDLKEIIFAPLLPNPFIASAERTGAAIFRKELNFARNRLLDEIGQADKKIDPIELLLKDYADYALPIKTNVDFTRQLESLVKKNSFIAKDYPEILDDFADIIGGAYTVNRNDELYYIPRGKRIKLSMDESSSSVRSLLSIGFYLKHEVKRGDLLIVDEPELNLHPENQRRVARLFARLVNVGVKVFITTHSDYLVKELNTLIMLNHDKLYLKKIAEQEGYKTEELLSPDQIRVYIAEKARIHLEGKPNKSECQTLTPADIDAEFGIEARSFDVTIEEMNRIQEAIVWGNE